MKYKKVLILILSSVFLISCQTVDQFTDIANEIKLMRAEKNGGLELKYFDTTVRAQDDFNKFVNGKWEQEVNIPSDRTSWGTFVELAVKTENDSLEILKEIQNSNQDGMKENQLIKTLYNAYIDTSSREIKGLGPLSGEIDKINQIRSLSDLENYFIQQTREGKGNLLYSWGVDSDFKNSEMNAIYLGGPLLSLGRNYYQKKTVDNQKILNEYKNYIIKILKLINEPKAEEKAEKIISFENKMAETLLTMEQSRNAELQYNLRKINQLKNIVKHVDLNKYLSSVGVRTNQVIIGEIKYYENFDSILNQTDIETIQAYLKLHLLSNYSELMNKELEKISFDFFSAYLKGQKEDNKLDLKALMFVNNLLGEAFGKLYVAKHFPDSSKEKMIELIDYLKISFRKHIQDVEWMSNTTRKKALDKLGTINAKIGFPDKWEDYSKLNINSNEKDLFTIISIIDKWNYQKELDKIGKKVDKQKWEITPQTVNAYYNPVKNEIVFPAAILQAPYFDPNVDPALNFGAIGAVIGHEITHGFDDSGSLFDEKGNLNNWWSAEDKANFNKVIQRLVVQFNQYEPLKGNFINGQATLGENIADLGGVNIAYDALQHYLKDKGNLDKIDGFTQDQRFFISWASVWRTKSTEEHLRNQLKTDYHSPGQFRAFAPLINIDAFYKAFEVKEGDKHYLKPEDRIKIW